MSSTDHILALLYDRVEGYFALEELCVAAHIGRAQLDIALAELRRRGQGLEALPLEGVRLVRPVRLGASLIERELGTRRVGRNVICFEEVDSTNDVALAAARQENSDGLAVVAEFQNRGRGRHGRVWLSPPGRNVLLSVLLVEPASPKASRQEALTIAAGLAAAESIEQTTGLDCELKWPNDVLLAGAKVAGALVETRREGGKLAVVIGVGINANAAPPEAVDSPATSLAERLGHDVERIELVRALLRRLDTWVARIGGQRLDTLHRDFLRRCRMLNERTTVVCDGVRCTGRVLDVDPLRGLFLCRDDDSRVHLPAARSTVVQ